MLSNYTVTSGFCFFPVGCRLHGGPFYLLLRTELLINFDKLQIGVFLQAIIIVLHTFLTHKHSKLWMTNKNLKNP